MICCSSCAWLLPVKEEEKWLKSEEFHKTEQNGCPNPEFLTNGEYLLGQATIRSWLPEPALVSHWRELFWFPRWIPKYEVSISFQFSAIGICSICCPMVNQFATCATKCHLTENPCMLAKLKSPWERGGFPLMCDRQILKLLKSLPPPILPKLNSLCLAT